MTRLNSPHYIRLRSVLAKARVDAGLTQSQVAEKLGRAQTFVSKYELGERRLDIVEYLEVCDCLNIDPLGTLRKIWKLRQFVEARD